MLDETSSTIFGDPIVRTGAIGRLVESNPGRFAWDLIFVDESQDCSNGERDFLRALYGHKRLVLADGVDQLVRRQYACDWNAGVPEGERVVYRLDTSLRMMRNIACFVNCFARALDFPMWYIAPQEQLAGGRVIVAVGEIDWRELLRAIVASAAERDADPADCLICLPPTSGNQDAVRERLLAAGRDANIALWDGTDAAMRASAVPDPSAVRLVRYESCRGLEGWITVALDVDDFVKNKLRYPNQNASDPQLDPAIVANRWLLVPLTRAVQTLIIVVRDPQAPIIARHSKIPNCPTRSSSGSMPPTSHRRSHRRSYDRYDSRGGNRASVTWWRAPRCRAICFALDDKCRELRIKGARPIIASYDMIIRKPISVLTASSR